MKKFYSEFGNLESAVFKCNEVFDTVKQFFPIDDIKQDTPAACDKDAPPNDKFSRTQLLLSGWQMVEENFPLPIQGLMERKYSGYTLTKERYKDVTAFSPMFALDCEMCRTSTGKFHKNLFLFCIFFNQGRISVYPIQNNTSFSLDHITFFIKKV